MATQPLDRYTLEQYLGLQDTLDYRSEFHDGLVLPVEAATPNHSRLVSRVNGRLEAVFPDCAVYDSSLNLYVATANKIFHPDVAVVCGNPSYPKPNCIDNPTILVEVTSPATKDYDHGSKREHYFTLPSLQHYLLVSQTEAAVGHYRRSGDVWIYSDNGSSASVLLGNKEIAVVDIYLGILP